jgi:O-antigen/teichoic acid export membrane protein
VAEEPKAPGGGDATSGGAQAEAAAAGRGVLYIAFAKFYFMLVGFLIEVRLPAILGRTVFGAYRVVSSTVSPFNNVLITGTIQAVARSTAQRPEDARSVQRAGLAMHLRVGLPLGVLFIALSPLTARLMHDPSKTGPLMLAGLIMLGYAFYAVFVGTANGLRQFRKQAGLDITMATLRAVGILGLASAGFGVYGALSGWVGATAIILVVASFAVGLPGRRRSDEAAQPLRPMIGFFVSLAVYLVLLNVLMVVDTILLKRLSTEWFVAHRDGGLAALAGVTPGWLAAPFAAVTSSTMADAQVGYYGAVQNLARLPYQAIIAVTFVIFPLVSRTTFTNDREATRRYVSTTLRYSLIFCTAIAVVFAANPLELLDVPYDRDYAVVGAPALMALALGTVAFSIFAIAGTILNGAGLTRHAITAAAVTLVVSVVANWLAIPRFVPGQALLLACSAATSGAMVIGAAVAGGFLRRQLGAFLPWLSLVRVGLATAAALALGRVLPLHGTLMTLVEAAAVGLAFLLALVVTGELKRSELQAIGRVLTRKRGAS